jgi:hypothetical protein
MLTSALMRLSVVDTEAAAAGTVATIGLPTSQVAHPGVLQLPVPFGAQG